MTKFDVLSKIHKKIVDLVDMSQLSDQEKAFLEPYVKSEEENHDVDNSIYVAVRYKKNTDDNNVAYEITTDERLLNPPTDNEWQTYPTDEHTLKQYHPVLYRLDGYADYDISKVKSVDDLHANIKKLISITEKFVGCPVKYINTGKEQGQMLINEAC